MLSTDYSKRESFAVKMLKEVIPANFKGSQVQKSKGFFVELFENNEVFPNHYLASTVDGVGSKVLIASLMEKFDTIGIDLVAMNANDLATLPLTKAFLFSDYIAAQHRILEKGTTKQIMKGIIDGLKMADTSNVLRSSIHLNLGKGETASLDEVISCPKEGFGFDLAALMLGFIEKKHAKMNVYPNMKIIAIESSGLHSNGFTSARHFLLNGSFEKRKKYRALYKGKFSLNFELPYTNKTLGEELLTPTLIYSKPLAALAKIFPYVIGINNTGFGLKNFNRLSNSIEFVINDPIKPEGIFEFMKENTSLSWQQMYERFNMGAGFFVLLNEKDTDKALSIIERHKLKVKIVGFTRKAKQGKVVLSAPFLKEKIVYKGY